MVTLINNKFKTIKLRGNEKDRVYGIRCAVKFRIENRLRKTKSSVRHKLSGEKRGKQTEHLPKIRLIKGPYLQNYLVDFLALININVYTKVIKKVTDVLK